MKNFSASKFYSVLFIVPLNLMLLLASPLKSTSLIQIKWASFPEFFPLKIEAVKGVFVTVYAFQICCQSFGGIRMWYLLPGGVWVGMFLELLKMLFDFYVHKLQEDSVAVFQHHSNERSICQLNGEPFPYWLINHLNLYILLFFGRGVNLLMFHDFPERVCCTCTLLVQLQGQCSI